MSDNIFNNPLGEDFKLDRYPPNPILRAWDSADELILKEIKEKKELKDKNILIINDSFGALSLSLKDYKITTYSDSFVSKQSYRTHFCNDLNAVKGEFDLVLIKIPKSLSFLEDILAKLSNLLTSNTELILGVMVKYLTPAIFDLIQNYIGETSTSLAQKKARLIFANLSLDKKQSPYPKAIEIEGFDFKFTNHSNVFSKNKLDIGSRSFLEHIPCGDYKNILDLGCGNGIIGISAKRSNPNASIHFCDDSYMAIKSAKENYDKYFKSEANYYWTNCIEDKLIPKQDLILCNPPFHQNNTIGDHISMQMFEDAATKLLVGGVLRVIGNHHLAYPTKLKKIFGNSKLVAKNKKFIIVDAIKA